MQEYYEMTAKQGTMRGFFHKPHLDKFPVCIIFHGFTGCNTGTKFSYTKLSRMLEQQGIGTLRMDFLGSGQSDLEFKDMTFANELECACQILETVLQMSSTKEVYLLGHSMGGAIASELAKIYPDNIQKMCLWAPAFNLPKALKYLTGCVEKADYYDHNGYEISHAFVEDMLKRDFYQDLDTYKNELMIIHGTKDMTVPFKISENYLQKFHHPMFYPIENASHNFDNLAYIQEVITLTFQFLTGPL